MLFNVTPFPVFDFFAQPSTSLSSSYRHVNCHFVIYLLLFCVLPAIASRAYLREKALCFDTASEENVKCISNAGFCCRLPSVRDRMFAAAVSREICALNQSRYIGFCQSGIFFWLHRHCERHNFVIYKYFSEKNNSQLTRCCQSFKLPKKFVWNNKKFMTSND